MAKEPDQTRWVGIRPTNPAENIPVVEQAPLTSIQVEPKPGSADFPVTLGAEVPHVIVDSGGGGGLDAGQPKIITDSRLTVVNTYYTLLDYTGKGILSVINFHTSGLYSDKFTVKITVDGTVSIEQDFATDNLYNSANVDYGGAVKHNVKLDWGAVGFDTSLKIEYKTSFGAWVYLSCFYQTIA